MCHIYLFIYWLFHDRWIGKHGRSRETRSTSHRHCSASRHKNPCHCLNLWGNVHTRPSSSVIHEEWNSSAYIQRYGFSRTLHNKFCSYTCPKLALWSLCDQRRRWKDGVGALQYFLRVHGNCVKWGNGQFARSAHMQSSMLWVLCSVSANVFLVSFLELANNPILFSKFSGRCKPLWWLKSV